MGDLIDDELMADFDNELFHDPFTDGCPKCGCERVGWITVGYDNYGSIKELACMECDWESGDEE